MVAGMGAVAVTVQTPKRVAMAEPLAGQAVAAEVELLLVEQGVTAREAKLESIVGR